MKRNLNLAILVLCALSAFLPFFARFSSESLLGIRGVIRFGFIGVLMLLIPLRIYIQKERVLVTPGMAVFTAIYLALITYFASEVLLDFAQHGYMPTYGVHFKLMSLPYIVFAIFAYVEYDNVEWFRKQAIFVIACAVIASVVSIVEWILGPELLMGIGMNFEIGRYWFHMGSALDANGNPIFRPFGTTDNHYDMSALLSLAVIDTYVLKNYFQLSWFRFTLLMFLFALALVTTINMTIWGLLILATVIIYGSELWTMFRNLKRWQSLLIIVGISVAAVVALGIVVISPIGERIVRNTDLNSGSSLHYRLVFLFNTFNAVIEKPYGWGWAYGDGGLTLPFWGTSDNYYLWYTVWGGVPFGVLLLLVFFTPSIYGFWVYLHSKSWASKDRSLFLIIAVWHFIGALCGISNGFIGMSGITSAFYWGFAGILFRIPQLQRSALNGS